MEDWEGELCFALIFHLNLSPVHLNVHARTARGSPDLPKESSEAMNDPAYPPWSRRRFLAATGQAGLAGLWGVSANALGQNAGSTPRGRAEHCIFLWLGGGMAQIDTWDPKRRGDPQKNLPGCYYDRIPTALPGVEVCEHLSRCAPLLDRMTIVRTVHHDVVNEHAAAVVRVHTGRPTTGTIRYPSIGSIVAHELGAAGEAVPAYVVIGYPSLAREPGFLGPRYGYLYVTDTQAGPTGFTRPGHVDTDRQLRRERLLARMRRSGLDPVASEYDQMIGQSLRLAGPDLMSAFELDQERDELRRSYGGEFGQRCLLSRRLIQAGVRFVEVSHNLNFINGTGWDTHNEGQLKQHLLIDELDRALSTLLVDLDRRKLLDRTLIVVGTEFGRPAAFDSGGGRGHHSRAFSMLLAGGGLRHGQVIGQTDELAQRIQQRPVSVPDFLATICAALNIDPARDLFDSNNRPVPITDSGQPMKELF